MTGTLCIYIHFNIGSV